MIGQVEGEQLAIEYENAEVTPSIGYIVLPHDPELSGPHSLIPECLIFH